MEFILLTAAFVTLIHGQNILNPGIDPLSEEMVEKINLLGTTWKAGRNFKGVSLNYIKRLLGAKRDGKSTGRLSKANILVQDDIPESFDARTAWPNCSSISSIQDQGDCSSSWAFASVQAMSDRICIHSKGRVQVALSAEDLMTCCDYYGDGCEGGSTLIAWEYWLEKGIVTGGPYGGEGCQPYAIEPCEHHVPGKRKHCEEASATPSCSRSCQVGYPKTYQEDKHYGASSYGFEPDEKQIRSEIMRNGPVAATFNVYSDFFSYKKGVYVAHSGKRLGQHSVRILGWGTENGTPYWLCANSWNTDWGDKGYFKIRRGNDECGIESEIAAGIPK